MLAVQFANNNDDFKNIKKLYYKNELDLDTMYEFETDVAKHFIDNIKIQPYKPIGFIFNTDVNINKWNFKIIIITNKNVYTANRYITDTTIGCY